jgi:hypothetical protein
MFDVEQIILFEYIYTIDFVDVRIRPVKIVLFKVDVSTSLKRMYESQNLGMYQFKCLLVSTQVE